MADESRDYSELLESTAEWENPFVPAPLGDTVVMERTWTVRREDAAQ